VPTLPRPRAPPDGNARPIIGQRCVDPAANHVKPMNFWDERYAEPGYKYGIAPNAFVVEQASRLPCGARVLLPGDGEGRNGAWLAEQGHRVLSVDASSVGLAKARALAQERGVTIETLHADLTEWTPAPASCDAVVLTFVHLPGTARREVHRRLANALVPGGWLILEGFHPRQLGRTSGGPKDVDMLVTLAALRKDFAGLLDERLGIETETQLDEGPGHQGAAVVTRYVGRRAG
jgi:SAM-dependent methyltransferase